MNAEAPKMIEVGGSGWAHLFTTSEVFQFEPRYETRPYKGKADVLWVEVSRDVALAMAESLTKLAAEGQWIELMFHPAGVRNGQDYTPMPAPGQSHVTIGLLENQERLP
jgi:hypothetical protein